MLESLTNAVNHPRGGSLAGRFKRLYGLTGRYSMETPAALPVSDNPEEYEGLEESLSDLGVHR